MEIFKEEAFQGIVMDAIEYDVIVENLEVITEAMMTKRLLLIESSKDQKEVVKSVNKYISDVKEFVNANTEKAEKLRKLSKILGYVALGSVVFTMVVSMVGTAVAGAAGAKAAAAVTGFGKVSAEIAAFDKAMKIPEILTCISMLITMISSIASAITADMARKVMLKLNPIKKQLSIYRDRLKDNHTVQDKVDKLIIKIETVVDKVSDDTATERVSSHSY